MSGPPRRSSTSPCKGEVGRDAAGWGSVRRFSRTQEMTGRARGLRSSLTDAERKLWQALRRDQLGGLHFRRQHPVGLYTLDFYCPALRLGIEVDGGQHGEDMHRVKDARRTAWLTARQITVVRFWNNEVLSNIEGVLSEILRVAEEARQRLTPSLTLPLSGGGSRSAVP